MKKSDVVDQLAAFIIDVSKLNPLPDKDQISLGLYRWIADNDITIFSCKEEE